MTFQVLIQLSFPIFSLPIKSMKATSDELNVGSEKCLIEYTEYNIVVYNL